MWCGCLCQVCCSAGIFPHNHLSAADNLRLQGNGSQMDAQNWYIHSFIIAFLIKLKMVVIFMMVVDKGKKVYFVR